MEIIFKYKYGITKLNTENYSKEDVDLFLSQGYKYLYDTEKPKEYDDTIHELRYEIVEREDGNYEYKYNIKISPYKIKNQITILKQQLGDSDYKVIKNMEAQMLNKELPYDPVALDKERQPLRDKINELEKLLIS